MFSFSVNVFKPNQPYGKLVGFAKIIIEDVVELDGFKIFNGSKGLFVSPPSREGMKDGQKAYFDQVKFLTFDDSPNPEGAKAIQDEIEKAVIEAYLAKGGQGSAASQQDAANAQANQNTGGGRKRLWK